MNLRITSLAAVVLLAAFAAPGAAQQKLGDLVAEGGYDWIIGRWVATTDEGAKIEVAYTWALDKHAVLSKVRMGGFEYQGTITLPPATQEPVESGADNWGGTWKGTWYEDPAGLARRVEHTSAEGEVRKGEIVHSRTGDDSIAIAFYGLDSSGYRNSEPAGKLTYKRQPTAATAEVSGAGQTSRTTDYQKLGDLIAEGGYEWLIGKWVATDQDRTYELENQPILDSHAALMTVRIGDFQYRGMVMYVPMKQEVVQTGADNVGGSWKSMWEEGDEGPVHKIVYTKPDGTTQKMEHVYVKVDGDTFRVKEYAVEASGARASEPRAVLTFNRQKAAQSQ